MQQENLKKCESCGMPLEPDTTSKFSSQYCIYCQNQKSGELKPFEEVRSGTINAAVKFMGKTREEAVKMADEELPKLPRWKK